MKALFAIILLSSLFSCGGKKNTTNAEAVETRPIEASEQNLGGKLGDYPLEAKIGLCQKAQKIQHFPNWLQDQLLTLETVVNEAPLIKKSSLVEYARSLKLFIYLDTKLASKETLRSWLESMGAQGRNNACYQKLVAGPTWVQLEELLLRSYDINAKAEAILKSSMPVVTKRLHNHFQAEFKRLKADIKKIQKSKRSKKKLERSILQRTEDILRDAKRYSPLLPESFLKMCQNIFETAAKKSERPSFEKTLLLVEQALKN